MYSIAYLFTFPYFRLPTCLPQAGNYLFRYKECHFNVWLHLNAPIQRVCHKRKISLRKFFAKIGVSEQLGLLCTDNSLSPSSPSCVCVNQVFLSLTADILSIIWPLLWLQCQLIESRRQTIWIFSPNNKFSAPILLMVFRGCTRKNSKRPIDAVHDVILKDELNCIMPELKKAWGNLSVIYIFLCRELNNVNSHLTILSWMR